MNGESIPAGQLEQRLQRLSPGSNVRLATVRHGDTRTVDVVLATDPGHGWLLSVSPGATREQLPRVDSWLSP